MVYKRLGSAWTDLTLKVHSSDRKDYKFAYTYTTMVSHIIEEIRKVVSPDVTQIDLVHGSTKLADDTTLTSLNLDPSEQLKFFVCRHRHAHRRKVPRARRICCRSGQTSTSPRSATLVELALPGITRKDCMRALRTVYFDTNRASTYLLAQSGGRAPPARAMDAPIVHEISLDVREALARLEAQFPGIDHPTVI
jgi:hypothetical protein